jgi:hypothetical protein
MKQAPVLIDRCARHAFSAALAFAAAFIVGGAALVRPAAAQETGGAASGGAAPGGAVFLGRSDVNADGVIDAGDTLTLWAVTPGQTPLRALSQPGESVLNQLVQPETGLIGYVALVGDAPVLVFASLTDAAARETIALDGLQFAIAQVFSEDALYLTGITTEGASVLMRARPGSPIETVALDLEFPTFRFSTDGRFALAYDAAFTTLVTVALDTFATTPITVGAPVVGEPTLSPGPRPVVAVPVTGEQGTAVRLFPLEGGEPRDLALDAEPTATDGTESLVLSWGNTGRVFGFDRLVNGALEEAPLHVVETETGAITRIGAADVQLRIVAWSADDAFAWVAQSVFLTDVTRVSYALLRTGEDSLFTLDLLNSIFQPTFGVWSSAGAQLALVGTAQTDGRAGVAVYDAETDAVTVVSNDAAAALTDVVAWSSDDARLYLFARTDDPIAQLAGFDYALHTVELSTRTSTLLTPPDLSPLPYALQLP